MANDIYKPRIYVVRVRKKRMVSERGFGSRCLYIKVDRFPKKTLVQVDFSPSLK